MKHALFAALCLAAVPASAETKPAPAKPEVGDFVRFREDAKGAQLQTAIGTYRNPQGVVVELIGAIHVADKAYYESLNKRFTGCESLLYEMVGEELEVVEEDAAPLPAKEKKPGPAPKPPVTTGQAAPPAPAKPATPPSAKSNALEETLRNIEAYFNNRTPGQVPTPRTTPHVAPKSAPAGETDAEESARGNMSWVHPLYNTLRTMLKLESQMEGIDYSKKNFIHADMTARQFASLQQERGEGFVQLWMRLAQSEMGQGKSPSGAPGLLKIFEVLSRPDSSTELKRLMGRLFDQAEKFMAGMETEEGSVIVVERNKVALAVMDREIAKGRKHLGIFYGAAHLPDMEQRLFARGFKREKIEWLTAWDLPPEPPPPAKKTAPPDQKQGEPQLKKS